MDMKTLNALTLISALALIGAGCATTDSTSSQGTASASSTASSSGQPFKYRTDDGRNIEIGRASASGDGLLHKNRHIEKCWIANVNLNDYDTLYIAPTASTAKYQPDEARLHELSKEILVREIANRVKEKRVFPNVVTSQSEIKPGARVLTLENTIIQYAKGGGAARYFVGLYGGGQPVLRVQGKMSDATKPVFTFEAHRSGTSAGARMTGAFMKDEDIQREDIHSLALDLTDFLAAKAGKYQVRN